MRGSKKFFCGAFLSAIWPNSSVAHFWAHFGQIVAHFDAKLLVTLLAKISQLIWPDNKQTWTWIGLKIEIGWLFHLPAQSAENCSSKKIHYYWSASSFFITMKLSPLLSQKRTVLLLLLFLFAIERLSLPPERGHNFIVIPGRFSHNTKSADAIFCLSTSMTGIVICIPSSNHGISGFCRPLWIGTILKSDQFCS